MKLRLFFPILLAAALCGPAAAAPAGRESMDDGPEIEDGIVPAAEGAAALADSAGAPRPAGRSIRPDGGSKNRIRFGFSVSGGGARIEGGDFNRAIRDANRWTADSETGGEIAAAIYWKQMKTMPNVRGEIFARFGRFFGLSLGVEYLHQTNAGRRSETAEISDTILLDDTLAVYALSMSAKDRYPQDLTVVPITLQLTGYLPLGRRGEAYVTAGPGLYLGTLRLTTAARLSINSTLDLFSADGRDRLLFRHENYTGIETEVQEAKGAAAGFQAGAGFAYALSGHVSLFGEALYRRANIRNWKGSADLDYFLRMTSAMTGGDVSVREMSEHESWDGDLWAYENPSFSDDRSYLAYGIQEQPPDAAYYRNVRKAEININGPVVRFGIRLTFGSGRGR